MLLAGKGEKSEKRQIQREKSWWKIPCLMAGEKLKNAVITAELYDKITVKWGAF